MDQASSQSSLETGRRTRAGDENRLSGSSDSSRPSLVVVYDSPQQCPYLDGRIARTPLEYPRYQLSPSDFDRLLEAGYRRTGKLFYRTQCPDCQSCIPVRVNANAFRMTKSMKRVLNRGRRELHVAWGTPAVDSDRLRLFNEHRVHRQLSQRRRADPSDYHEFLVDSCVPTVEIAFYKHRRLIGVSIVDQGQQALNAVYTHFDPNFGRYSIGTLAVLLQIQRAIETGREYVYLGLYVAENRHLNYKRRFQPQQRLVDGHWKESVAD